MSSLLGVRETALGNIVYFFVPDHTKKENNKYMMIIMVDIDCQLD